MEARRRVSYLPKKTLADVAREGAASQRPPAAVRPTSSELAATPSAPAAVAASAAPPTQQTGPSTPKAGAAEAAPTSKAPSSAGNGQRSQIPQGDPSTSGLVGAGVLPSGAGLSRKTSRSQERLSGVSQQAMDTTPVLKAHQTLKEL
ncbi:cyclin-dependent kinase inhibitor 1C-like [Dermacentor albipictus]|uniref:cyclin-dependent kinase inhibitor 1C-like n=1 Tax=Dermacentor albipictus TaxID=60249 RepID=UPI0038FCD487